MSTEKKLQQGQRRRSRVGFGEFVTLLCSPRVHAKTSLQAWDGNNLAQKALAFRNIVGPASLGLDLVRFSFISAALRGRGSSRPPPETTWRRILRIAAVSKWEWEECNMKVRSKWDQTVEATFWCGITCF